MTSFVFNTLSTYDGAINDRKHKFFVDVYGYDSTMSVDDMEKLTLENLGYSGSLFDMWSSYLKNLGASGTYADNITSYFDSTFYGIYSPYILNGYVPEFLADFKNGVYSVGKAKTYWEKMVTSSLTTPQTVIDSDGVLKWAPHNHLKYSDDFSKWLLTQVSISGDTATATGTDPVIYGDGGGAVSLPVGEYTLEVELKGFGTTIGKSARAWMWFAGTAVGTSTIDNKVLTADYQIYKSAVSVTTAGTLYPRFDFPADIAVIGDVSHIRRARLYRSDLGGMQNATDGTSYVPTGASAVYFPGIDWTDSVKPGPEVWEGRTNLVTNSAGSQTALRTTPATGTTTASDGTSTMRKMIEDTSASTTHAEYFAFTASDSTKYTLSSDLKAGTRTWAKLGIKRKDASIVGMWVNLTTGAIGTVDAGVTYGTPISLGNGIWRYSVTVDVLTGASSPLGIIYMADADASISYTGDGSSYIEHWGWQIEEGASASPYIPTTSAAVTRSAGGLTAVQDGSLPFTGYDQAEGTMVVAGAASIYANQRYWQIHDGSETNRLATYRSSSGSVNGLATDAGVLQTAVAGGVYTETSTIKNVFAWAENDYAISVKGGAVSIDNSGTIPATVNLFSIGMASLVSYVNGTISYVAYYPKRLPDATLVTESGS